MTTRVVQWGSGNVGRHAIRTVVERPDLELAGLLVTNPAKVGKDAAEIAGLEGKVGVVATSDVDAIIALDADVVLHMPLPSLIHGDLWTGNVLCHDSRIAGLVDPAIYHADAEIELAFATLFGTFGDAFFARYTEHRPLAPGFFEARRDLYNLYPLLVHTALFGGSYARSVDRTVRRFV